MLGFIDMRAGQGRAARSGPFSVIFDRETLDIDNAALDEVRHHHITSSTSLSPIEETHFIDGGLVDDRTSLVRTDEHVGLEPENACSDRDDQLVQVSLGSDNTARCEQQEHLMLLRDSTDFVQPALSEDDASLLQQFPVHEQIPEQALAPTFPPSTKLGTSIYTSLSRDSSIDQLMHHYVVNITDLLQPVSHPENPYRTLYAPAALEVISGLLDNTPAAKATMHNALYHSVLAAAAHHLGSCTSESSKYKKLGAQHKDQALLMLRKSIDPARPASNYKTLLITMLSLVTIEVGRLSLDQARSQYSQSKGDVRMRH